MTRDALRRVARTFVIAFVGILLPGVFGWLNDLTKWASEEGQRPFPDATSLAYLGVSAIVAGLIAALNLIVVGIEDASGHGILRTPPVKPTPPETGRAVVTWGALAVVVLVVVLVFLLL